MVYAFSAIHVLVCLFLIIVVLLQHGKGADVAGLFTGQGSQAAFGPRGAATILTKATTWSAVVFMITSVVLSIYAGRRSTGGKSVLEGVKPAQTQSQPAPPATPPKAPEPQPMTPR